ncbi:MAG: restriction endonuclease subunit S, partial [Bacteroidota bacterium]
MGNEDFRIDSDFFNKRYLDFDLFLKKKTTGTISTFAKVSDGDHSKFPENQKEEVRYLQAKDIKHHFIENDNPVFISKEYFLNNKRSHVTEESVILSIMGSVGDMAIIPKGFKPCLANRAIAIIKDIDGINPYYLFAYLSTTFGQLQIDRQKNGGVQVRINLDVLAKVKIPLVNDLVQNKIEELVKLAHSVRKNSKALYAKAENILLEEVGLKNFEPSKEPFNIKNFKGSFIPLQEIFDNMNENNNNLNYNHLINFCIFIGMHINEDNNGIYVYNIKYKNKQSHIINNRIANIKDNYLNLSGLNIINVYNEFNYTIPE